MADEWTLDAIRHFYNERLDELERRSDERLHQIQDTMRVERDAIDKRFDQANRYKETYAESLTKVANEGLKRVEFDSRIANMQDKIETLSRTNWPLYSSFGGIAISMIVGLWVIVGLKIEATNQPVVVSLEQTKIANEARDRSINEIRAEFTRYQQAEAILDAQRGRDMSTSLQAVEVSKSDRAQLNERVRNVEGQVLSSQQADANSKTDRGQLNIRVHDLEENLGRQLADRKSVEATLTASLVEVETQFCSSDTTRNLMHANDLRIQSILWERAGLGHYPTDNSFYPTICNRNIHAAAGR